MKKLKICRVATVPFALLGSSRHLEKLEELNCEVTVLSSKNKGFNLIEKLNIHDVAPLSIFREISIINDTVSIWNLYWHFRKNKYDIIHSNTPKAGLLVAISGLIARSPVVIHTYTGQRWHTLTGWKRILLYNCDRIIACLNKKCFTDSWSQRQFLLDYGVGTENSLSCIHKGSFAGVDLNRFNLDKYINIKEEILQDIGCNKNNFIITYIGRIVKDKGIGELVGSFLTLKIDFPQLKLLLVGPIERKGNPVSAHTLELIKENHDIINIGFSSEPERFLAISHIFCLPSYREGFPTVVLEAAAMKVPAIATNIVGGRDAIIDGVTGLLIDAKSKRDLILALKNIFSSDDNRKKMGEMAYKRVQQDFNLNLIAQKNVDEYRKIALEPSRSLLFVKRAFDLIFSLVSLSLFTVPFIVIFILIKITSKGPALHWSSRVGKNNLIFRMPKFRSMKLNTPQVATHLLTDGEDYLTPLGRLLRQSSLDEMPQIYSILMGDMSFVGPRPALFNQKDLIQLRTEFSVEKIRPGLTGWAQINGRDELTIQDKVKLDREYTEKISLMLDIKIILLTFLQVFLRKGIH